MDEWIRVSEVLSCSGGRPARKPPARQPAAAPWPEHRRRCGTRATVGQTPNQGHGDEAWTHANSPRGLQGSDWSRGERAACNGRRELLYGARWGRTSFWNWERTREEARRFRHLVAKLGTQFVDDLCAAGDDDHGDGAIYSTVRSRLRLTTSARAPVVAWKEKME